MRTLQRAAGLPRPRSRQSVTAGMRQNGRQTPVALGPARLVLGSKMPPNELSTDFVTPPCGQVIARKRPPSLAWVTSPSTSRTFSVGGAPGSPRSANRPAPTATKSPTAAAVAPPSKRPTTPPTDHHHTQRRPWEWAASRSCREAASRGHQATPTWDGGTPLMCAKCLGHAHPIEHILHAVTLRGVQTKMRRASRNMNEHVGVQVGFRLVHLYKTAGQRPARVSGGGLEPPRPLRALAPQASASAIPPPGQGGPRRPSRRPLSAPKR